ncbi:MAG: hypothetical protein AAF500_20665 [Myxococcota bacterium]
MGMRKIALYVGLGAALAVAGCSDDETGGEVDTSGACGVICEGGQFDCTIGGFDPSDGLEACTRACQAQWPSEQDPSCIGDATFVLSCVDANQSCETLDNNTCGTAQTDLIDCASMPTGAGGSGGVGGGPVIDVAVEAFSLTVRDACDADGEGEFIISVRLRDDSGEETVLIDDDLENLVQARGGITQLDGILATGAVPAVTGTRVLVSTSVLETDSNVPQVSRGASAVYEYDAETPCWRLEDEEECLGPEGEIDVILVRLVGDLGDPCDAQLRSRFSAGPPR